MTIEPPCIETCWNSVRPTRVVAVAVQPADGDDFAFHAVEKYTDQEWSGTIPALSADAALLDVFVQIRCRPGQTYAVAEAIAMKEIHSELYSTSGEWDLLMKLYIPSGQDIGKFINDELLGIEGIVRSLTTLTFKAF